MTQQAQSSSADPEELLAALGRSWLWALGFGVVTFAAGIVLLVWPHASLRAVAVVIGLQLLVAGVARLVTAFSRGYARAGDRVLYVLIALLSILAGVLCLHRQVQTIGLLTMIVGVVWLLGGIVLTFAALAQRDAPYRWLTVCGGGLSIVASIVVLGYPVQSAVAVARLFGLWLLILGLFEIGVAFAMRATVVRARTGSATLRAETFG